MKKRILFGLFGVVAMAAAAIVTVSTVDANSTESDLLTKNIEALTRYEADITCSSQPGSLGQCWTQKGGCCAITGYPTDHCTGPKC